MRFDMGARQFASHGTSVQEICTNVNPEAMVLVTTMLDVNIESLFTYAVGPAWQQHGDLLRSELFACSMPMP